MAKPVGPYTPVVRTGDLLFCSGQIGLDGESLVSSTEGQVRQAISNLEALLKENGAGLDDVVKTTLFLIDMAEYGLVNESYAGCFGEHRPARSAVGVAALPKGARFEIEAIANAR